MWQHPRRVDDATGLPDERAWDAWFEQHAGIPASAVVVGLPQLAQVASRHGRSTADELLRAVAVVVARATPEDVLVGHHGGDRFFVVSLEQDARRTYDLVTAVGQQVATLTTPSGTPVELEVLASSTGPVARELVPDLRVRTGRPALLPRLLRRARGGTPPRTP